MKLYRTSRGHILLNPKVDPMTGQIRGIRVFNGKTKQYCFEEVKTSSHINIPLKPVECAAVLSKIGALVKHGIQWDEERLAKKEAS